MTDGGSGANAWVNTRSQQVAREGHIVTSSDTHGQPHYTIITGNGIILQCKVAGKETNNEQFLKYCQWAIFRRMKMNRRFGSINCQGTLAVGPSCSKR